MERHIHIVSLTVPYPVNYGGVYDLFYKLPALQQQGIKIHLHCFDYGRGPQPELERYCASVEYYKRDAKKLFSGQPYIVASRRNENLFQRLLQDNHPILMEGIHCTALLQDERFAGRTCLVRLHNIESDYYYDLARAAHSPLKKLYYRREARLLKKYERQVARKAVFLTVTSKDADAFRNRYGARQCSYLPLFIPPWQVEGAPGVGSYCLYQGDLSVEANIRVAEWLVKKIFAGNKISLVIAGKRPPASLRKLIESYENIRLEASPSVAAMQELIREAHINIIPSLSATGIKLKLLNALFNGRHCVVNSATIAGTGLDHLCHLADNTAHLTDIIAQLYHQPFTADEQRMRKEVLENYYNNSNNARQLVEAIWPSVA